MKVLITGGAGFIGSHLTDKLLAQGNQALVIDNYATGRRDNLTPHPNLTVVEGSIVDTELVHRLFEDFKPEQVVHAAASYKDPENWLEDSQTNVAGTVNIVQAAKKNGVAKLIYFQTSLCYGLHPLEQPITLNHPILPQGSSYSISKTAAEQYIELSGVDYISFRLANAYGPRNLSGPLPTFYHRLTQNKPCFVMNTRRDFIFIDDLISVVLRALEGKGGRGAYHVSSGSDFSIKELFDATLSALNLTLDKEVEVRERNPDDVFTILLDPSKTNQDFGWQVTTPLTEGVAKAIQWYQQYGITQTYTHLKNIETGKS
ncbi:MAG: NAD-dependent epimerase/dehydratase family protein [Cyanobacteriota bacterium]|jgi:UDP-glucose 4-epimerase